MSEAGQAPTPRLTSMTHILRAPGATDRFCKGESKDQTCQAGWIYSNTREDTSQEAVCPAKRWPTSCLIKGKGEGKW